MAKKQNLIAAGLNGLLSAALEPEAAPQERPKHYKSVCYSIDTEIAGKISYIAWYDRRKLKATVEDAFTAYIEKWEKEHGEITEFDK